MAEGFDDQDNAGDDQLAEDVIEEIEEVSQEVSQLDGQDDDSLKEEKEDLKEMEEELLDNTFPPGCSWECYLDNYPDLFKNIPHSEEVALNHYLNYGRLKKHDCHCKE